jgi:transposase
MGEPHPAELRQRVVKAYELGEGAYSVIAARFGVGEASVKRWVWRHRECGNVTPTRKGGGTPSVVRAADIERLLDELRDATANELTVAYNRSRRREERLHVSSIKRALHRHGYTVKKTLQAVGVFAS